MPGAPLVGGLDKPLSPLALGTAFYRLDSKAHWFALLDRYVACGGNVIDSAHGYGDSERVIGEWLAARAARERLVIITKGGHGDGRLPRRNFRETIGQELERSLQRLQTDHIDLYLLHRDNPAVPVGPIVDCLNEHLDRGRIRAFGGSNWEYPRVDAANHYAARHGLRGFAAVSNHLSLARPTVPFYPGLVAADLAGRRWHERTGIPLLSWSAQARGFFTGRYRPSALEPSHTPPDAFTKRMLEVYGTPDNLERLRRAEQLGREKGACSAVQIALAWLLHQPIKVVPIVGPHTEQELASCLGAFAVTLTPRDLAWLDLEL